VGYRWHHLNRNRRHLGYVEQSAYLRGHDFGRADLAVQRQFIYDERRHDGWLPPPETPLPLHPASQSVLPSRTVNARYYGYQRACIVLGLAQAVNDARCPGPERGSAVFVVGPRAERRGDLRPGL
jgi:hypothetical protein